MTRRNTHLTLSPTSRATLETINAELREQLQLAQEGCMGAKEAIQQRDECLSVLRELHSAAIMYRQGVDKAGLLGRLSNETVNMMSAMLLVSTKLIARTNGDGR